MENKRVVISSRRCLKETISTLVIFYTVFTFILISGFVGFAINKVHWIGYIYVILWISVSLGIITFSNCHSYKLSKIIIEDDEIILSYSLITTMCGVLFRLISEEKKYEKRRYIEEKGKKKLFNFSYKYHIKCSEIVGYDINGFLIPNLVNKKTSKKTTKFVYRNIPIEIPTKSKYYTKEQVSKYYTKEQVTYILTQFRETGTRIRETGKKTDKTTTMFVYRKIPVEFINYTKKQMLYILTYIRENGGLQGDAYDNALKLVSKYN